MNFFIIAITLIVDQATKFLAVRYVPRDDQIPVIPGFIHLRLSDNYGAAFSSFEDHSSVLGLVTIAAVIMIGWIAWSAPREQRWVRWGYSLILGGALGNLGDRLFRGETFLGGPVVDFMQWPWFINNVADDAICVGVALVALGFFLYPHKERLEDVQPTEESTTEPSKDA